MVMSAPAAASISSVWARVATGSITTVSPSAPMPASSTADFTWALAMGGVYSMPTSGPPVTVRGGRQCSPSPLTAAPIRIRGSATRSIGRPRSESSPVRTVVPDRVATTPARRRMPVPALPMSMGPAGGPSRDRPPRTVTAGAVPVDLGAERGRRRGRCAPHRRRRTARRWSTLPRPERPAAAPGGRWTCPRAPRGSRPGPLPPSTE